MKLSAPIIFSMEYNILELLRQGQGYVSGEQLSRQLKVSRQALWKHMQQLRAAGYEITAVPHLGYRLDSCPDRLFGMEIKHSLNTKILGKKIIYYDVLDSTMNEAMRLGMNEASEGTLVIAEGQTRGRGRMGREWFSPKYKGIYFSLVLRPQIPPNVSPVFSLLSACGIREAVKEFTGIDLMIKWPNDLFLNGKKIGGILNELSAETDKVRFIVIGAGINVNNEPGTLPENAASLKDYAKKSINRAELVKEILRKIESNYALFNKEGPVPIIEKCRSCNLTLGERVRVQYRKNITCGFAIDLDIDGGLLIREDSGIISKVMSGDVVHLHQTE